MDGRRPRRGDTPAIDGARPRHKGNAVKNMTRIIAAGVTLAMLPGCGSSSPPKGHASGGSAGSRTPEEVAQAAPYRVGGAGLMMTPAQVAAALGAEGYAKKESSMNAAAWSSDSFEDLVDERISGHASAHPTRVPTHEEWTKGAESVSVDYGIYPGMPKAIGIKWATDDGSPGEAEIRATLTKRYGSGFQLKSFLPPQWCTPSPCGQGSATLTASSRDISLLAPSAMSQPVSFNQRMDAAVRAKGGASKGSF